MIRRGWLVGALLAVAGAAALAVSELKQPSEDGGEARQASARPTLALLTSLPLVFGERFGLSSGGSAALRRLEQYYTVQPIGVADAINLTDHQLLLMAHPRAQPAEALVDLDRWVRGGGRLMLLADPRLDWHSDRPLGDRLRPPPAFADTGLLKHWGLELNGPQPVGPASVGIGSMRILAASPGRFTSRGECKLAGSGFVARCRIGKGAVTLIADADFLNVEGEGALDGPTEQNLDLLAAELARLGSL